MKKDDIIKKINDNYRQRKMEKYPYVAPGDLPTEVQSDQIKAVVEVFAELLEDLQLQLYDDGTTMEYKKMIVDKATKLADKLLNDKK